jgi:hypothetical protein
MEIKRGARYVASADIRSFFTHISKPLVTSIIASVVNDQEFVAFLNEAIHVELSNLAELRERALDFPIEEIGVAQGNSLSPLLGNIVLSSFDHSMNEGDCRCIRYIDDFVILAPSAKAANARLRKAVELLKKLEMQLSPEKSSTGARHIQEGFDFLGINISPGLIRPSIKAQRKLFNSVEKEFTESRKAFEKVRKGGLMTRARSLIATLKRVDGLIEGWGKHYWFCNDARVFEHLDTKITEAVRHFLGAYSDARNRLDPKHQKSLLGIFELVNLKRAPFEYPKSLPSTASATGSPFSADDNPLG